MSGIIKTFLIGLGLGSVGAAVLASYIPFVNLQREPSLISVQPNGGAVETFFINLPDDRIAVTAPETMPKGVLSFLESLDQHNIHVQAEVFKVRNQNNKVIGIGSRLSSSKESTSQFVEWTVHFPARGTMYAKMHLNPEPNGLRRGRLVAGTRDFKGLSGSITEEVFASPPQKNTTAFQIHLKAVLTQALGDLKSNM